ncbi:MULTISPECIES: hypothetical protein [Streptomyces]|nr:MULTISPECIES: hypothetical protein [Streptomyces]
MSGTSLRVQQLLAHVETVEVRQTQVEQHHVRGGRVSPSRPVAAHVTSQP